MILLYLFCGDFSGSFLVNFASLPMPNNIGVFSGAAICTLEKGVGEMSNLHREHVDIYIWFHVDTLVYNIIYTRTFFARIYNCMCIFTYIYICVCVYQASPFPPAQNTFVDVRGLVQMTLLIYWLAAMSPFLGGKFGSNES